MNTTRSMVAGLMAAASFSVFAINAYAVEAGDQGLPPNIAAQQEAAEHAVAQRLQAEPHDVVAQSYVPDVLIVPGGEVTEVPNPAFHAAPTQRASAHDILESLRKLTS